MSINIYKEESFETIKYLCDEDWDLPTQMDALEKWLISEGKKLPKGKYVADIGFGIRKDANGGGAILNSIIIKILNEIGMEIYFSEYRNEKQNKKNCLQQREKKIAGKSLLTKILAGFLGSCLFTKFIA